jgi:hypothetical protein
VTGDSRPHKLRTLPAHSRHHVALCPSRSVVEPRLPLKKGCTRCNFLSGICRVLGTTASQPAPLGQQAPLGEVPPEVAQQPAQEWADGLSSSIGCELRSAQAFNGFGKAYYQEPAPIEAPALAVVSVVGEDR